MIYDANFGVLTSLLTVSAWPFKKPGSPSRNRNGRDHRRLALAVAWLLHADLFRRAAKYPRNLRERQLDGANGLQKLLHVTVPMLWPITSVVIVINIIGGIKVFETI